MKGPSLFLYVQRGLFFLGRSARDDSFFRRVFRLIPRISADFLWFPPVASMTILMSGFSICRRKRSWRLLSLSIASPRRPVNSRIRSSMICSSGAVERSGAPSALASSRATSSRRRSFPGERTASLCTKFSSSRTFPFQLWDATTSSASFENDRGGRERIAQYFWRKKSARRGMSSRLSERGGTRIGKTFSRSKRSSRNFPSAIIRRRSRLVAAMTRPWNFRFSFDPSLENSFSCSTRRSFAWRSGGMSPTSSRNRVPPEDASSFPSRDASAPVNAPFSKPNSSASCRSRGMADALTATNGPPRVPRSWMQRATSSFPTPRSPWSRTVASESATFPTPRKTSRMARLFPTIRADFHSSGSSVRNGRSREADGGHDEEPGRGSPRLGPFEDLDSFHAGHPDVDEGRDVKVLRQQGERLLPVLREVARESHPRDRLLQHPADALVVVGYEDFFHVPVFFPGLTGRDILTDL